MEEEEKRKKSMNRVKKEEKEEEEEISWIFLPALLSLPADRRMDD